MDFLSDVLRTVQLSSAAFYKAEFCFPWSFRAPASSTLLPWIPFHSGRAIVCHWITAGKAWICLEGESPLSVEAGDLVVLPEGDAHLMGSGPRVEPADNEQILKRIFKGAPDVPRLCDGGEMTTIVCGYLCRDTHMNPLLLSGLPRLLKVSILNRPACSWMEQSILFSAAQGRAGTMGLEALLAKLSEALLVETLRQYATEQPDAKTGWLAAARNPDMRRALALLHLEPAREWSIEELAQEAGVSRSVLAVRFQRYLGTAPMTYLLRWRLQLGARALRTTNTSVAEIASASGYRSEAAFNRAFKREFGVPPARFRRGYLRSAAELPAESSE